MTHPKLSIIIVNWNTAKITCQNISSLRTYLSTLNPEIIVVDNASTDNSVSEIGKLQHLLKIGNLKLKINLSNLGFAAANNIGAKSATGDYLLFLNSDMLAIDNSIIKMLDYLHSHPQIGAIGPRFLNPDKSPQASVLPPQTLLNAFRFSWLRQNTFLKYSPSKPQNVWAISGGAIMISKANFQKINGWNERYFFYFEDLDLCRRLRSLHLYIYYYPLCRLIHYHGASGSLLLSSNQQWRRLIPGSIIYHGRLKHALLTFILWSGQKIHQLLSK